MGRVVGLSMMAVALALASGPAMARTLDARDGFVQSCVRQMDMSQTACSCVADKAMTQLDAKSIAYLEIQANNGPVAAAAAKALSGAEIRKIDKFMRTVPDQCQAAR